MDSAGLQEQIDQLQAQLNELQEALTGEVVERKRDTDHLRMDVKALDDKKANYF